MSKKIYGTIKSAPHAFKIFNVLNTSRGSVISVTPGTVNSVMPLNITAKDATRGIGLAQFNTKKDVTNYIILRCRSNGQYINNAEIIVDQMPPALQTPVLFGLPSSVDVLLGVVFNDQIYQCITSNICLGAYVSYVEPNYLEDAVFQYNVFLVWGETRTV